MEFEDIKRFEESLDRAMRDREIFKMSAPAALRDAFGLISVADAGGLKFTGTAQMLRNGLNIALPTLIKGNGSGADSDIGQVARDLAFLSHYYLLRDYLYYSYNAPGAFSWTASAQGISVAFSDASIPQQFSQGFGTVLRDLIMARQQGMEASGIEEILYGAEEFGDGAHIQRAFELVKSEAQVRAALKFDLLDPVSSGIALKRYGYETFRRVYEHLLTKLLYHRHFARANSTWTTFEFPKEQLVNELVIATNLNAEDIRSVLDDLAYSPRKQLPPMYFSMIDHPLLPSFLMAAEDFVDGDTPAQFLRVQAGQDPNWFLSHISNPLGDQLVDRLASMFAANGFFIEKNVSLASLDPLAPDIDLLAVSREETFGYFAFAIEVKATLPSTWAKDYLRALDKGGLAKAFSQVKRVFETLDSDAGSAFITERVSNLDPDPQEEGHMILKGLIVTSQNSGMFFATESAQTAIIDFRTLGQLLKASSGDVLYIDEMLKNLRESPLPQVMRLNVEIEGVSVSYDVIAASDPVFFPSHGERSTETDAPVVGCSK